LYLFAFSGRNSRNTTGEKSEVENIGPGGVAPWIISLIPQIPGPYNVVETARLTSMEKAITVTDGFNTDDSHANLNLNNTAGFRCPKASPGGSSGIGRKKWWWVLAIRSRSMQGFG
jgi:hypothetical protein